MRTITATLFITLDGVVGGDEEMETWHFPYLDEKLGEAAMGAYEAADTVLLGRVTYDTFAGAWPAREDAGEDDAAFAKRLGDMRKVVVSKQRLQLTWRNSEQLQGDVVEGVAALKNEPGNAGIVVPGSISLVRQLLHAGLVDRLHLMVHPIAARTGFQLFDSGQPPIPLRLISSETLPTGVLNLVYAPGDTDVEAAAPVDRTQATTADLARHRSLVAEVFARLDRGDVDGIGELLHESFVSHNPRVPHDPAATDGREAFLAFLRSPDGKRLLAATVDIRRMAADGDNVWVHNHLGFPGSPGIAAIDIFRVEDGLVAEHWDVVQPVPEDLPHPHGMF